MFLYFVWCPFFLKVLMTKKKGKCPVCHGLISSTSADGCAFLLVRLLSDHKWTVLALAWMLTENLFMLSLNSTGKHTYVNFNRKKQVRFEHTDELSEISTSFISLFPCLSLTIIIFHRLLKLRSFIQNESNAAYMAGYILRWCLGRTLWYNLCQSDDKVLISSMCPSSEGREIKSGEENCQKWK